MARVTKDATFGPLSGKVGPVVASNWNGIHYIRALPQKRTGKISAAEQANRDKFKMAQVWLQPIISFLRIGFKNYLPTVRGFNAAKSWLMKNALEQTETGFVIHPSKMLVSHGDLPLPENLRLGEVENNKLPVYWDIKQDDYGHSFDQCMLLAYNIEKGFASMVLTGQFKNAGSDSLTIYKSKGDTYHIYAAFIAADRSRVSNSVYLGAITT